MPGGIGDVVVDRFFRRPRGMIARRWWRDPKPHHEIFRDVLAAADLAPNDRLLEVGCGGGTFLEWALRSGCSAAAVDHSLDMVRLAEATNAAAVAEGRLEVRQAPGERLPYPDAAFICAVTMNVFFFLDGKAALAELARVLAPGGRLVLHTVAPDPPASVMPPLLARRMAFYDDECLAALLRDAGFTDVAVERRGKGELQLATARRSAP
ncbi:ubiquinone/menaquinone biosynthesis C-methylase UbiE [Pseudonocardia kunmingensis]|uniref:Ubiquinone/menaquinone biosynthesis C-methylase UbiE n=1 Tax=Pseudonocardia kunmingensis TaxID=630975 RepID=A0A543D9X7_9PSEU|nr:ubiquinone/menaquinone biosynthesis C-methylase UbiE [Pseudonocardia kunmingensis]